MSRGVDVLAAIDAAIEGIHGEGYECRYLQDAYGAVVELIEVANQFDIYKSSDFGDTSILDNEDLWNRLSSALARVRGSS